MMEYKGYVGRVEYDAENDSFHGEVVDTRDVITFAGRSVDELHQAFKDSVDTYLDFCKECGKSPEKPFSGQFVARIDPDLHRQLATLAALAGKSLNALVAEILSRAAQELLPHLGSSTKPKAEPVQGARAKSAKRPAAAKHPAGAEPAKQAAPALRERQPQHA